MAGWNEARKCALQTADDLFYVSAGGHVPSCACVRGLSSRAERIGLKGMPEVPEISMVVEIQLP